MAIFYPMDQNLYLEIVEHYLDKANMPFNDEVRAESLRWCQMGSALWSSGLSVF